MSITPTPAEDMMRAGRDVEKKKRIKPRAVVRFWRSGSLLRQSDDYSFVVSNME